MSKKVTKIKVTRINKKVTKINKKVTKIIIFLIKIATTSC